MKSRTCLRKAALTAMTRLTPYQVWIDFDFSRHLDLLLTPIAPGREVEAQLSIRVMADTIHADVLRFLNHLLLGGHCEHFNRTYWLQAIQDSFDQVPMVVEHLKLLHELIVKTHLQPRLAHTPHKLQVRLSNGTTLLDSNCSVTGSIQVCMSLWYLNSGTVLHRPHLEHLQSIALAWVGMT